MYLEAEDREWECIGEEIFCDGKDIARLVEDTAYVYDMDMSDALIEWATAKAEDSQEQVTIIYFESWERWDGSLKEKEKTVVIDPQKKNKETKENKEMKNCKNYSMMWELCFFVNGLELDEDLEHGEGEMFRDIQREFLLKWEIYNRGDAELPEAEAAEAIAETKKYLPRIWEMFMEENAYYEEEE